MTNLHEVKIHVFPGGQMPIRAMPGVGGLDCFTRAILPWKNEQKDNSGAWVPMVDFGDFPEVGFLDWHDRPYLHKHVGKTDDGRPAWKVFQGETVQIGLGFAVDMPPGLMLKVHPRSSSIKAGLQVLNEGVIWDSNYQGEIVAVLRYIGPPYYSPHFNIAKGDRLVSVSFEEVPRVKLVETSLEDFSPSERGTRGEGSTGR